VIAMTPICDNLKQTLRDSFVDAGAKASIA
jgi:hypothetical protein